MQDCISDLCPCRRDLGSGALRERWVLSSSPSKKGCWAAAFGHAAVLGTWVLSSNPHQEQRRAGCCGSWELISPGQLAACCL